MERGSEIDFEIGEEGAVVRERECEREGRRRRGGREGGDDARTSRGAVEVLNGRGGGGRAIERAGIEGRGRGREHVCRTGLWPGCAFRWERGDQRCLIGSPLLFACCSAPSCPPCVPALSPWSIQALPTFKWLQTSFLIILTLLPRRPRRPRPRQMHPTMASTASTNATDPRQRKLSSAEATAVSLFVPVLSTLVHRS